METMTNPTIKVTTKARGETNNSAKDKAKSKEEDIKMLELYLERVSGSNMEDKKEFSQLIREWLAFSKSSFKTTALKIADKFPRITNFFMKAPGTLSRWAAGHSAPAVYVRKEIKRIIIYQINRFLVELRNGRKAGVE